MDENDPGAVEWGFYTIKGDTVTLTDEGGQPLVSGRMQLKYERTIREPLSAEQVARQLIMGRYKAGKKGTNFNRPIVFRGGRVA